jgi:hypothetical protein
MKNKMIWISLGGLLGLTAVVAGTIIITNDLSNEQEYAGRGRDQYAEPVYVNNDRVGNQVNTNTTYETPDATVTYNETYTLDQMITMAITDEYLAHKEYEIILDAYGNINPFANIINAEVTHIEALLPLFEAYDIAVPVDNAANLVALPSTLQEAYETGVQAEVNNIGMYESFLKEDLPQDVRDVFEALMAASEKHLQSFSQKASKY